MYQGLLSTKPPSFQIQEMSLFLADEGDGLCHGIPEQPQERKGRSKPSAGGYVDGSLF